MAEVTSIQRMLDPSGSWVAPSGRRGPWYCPTKISSPWFSTMEVLLQATGNFSKSLNMLAVSGWPTTEYGSFSWVHFRAPSKEVTLTSTAAQSSGMDNMDSGNALARYFATVLLFDPPPYGLHFAKG